MALAVQKPVFALGPLVRENWRGLTAKSLRTQQDEVLLGLTFEVSGHRRWGGLDRQRKMGRRPCAGWPSRHAVGGPLD